MKVTKNVKLTLNTTVFCARMKGEKDGKAYDFVSTRVSDDDGHLHGVAIDAMTWNSIAGVASPMDTVVFEGTLAVPEEGDDEYADAIVTRKRTGETYVSGELIDSKPVGFTKGVFPGALYPKIEDMPVYEKTTKTVQV